MCVASSTLEDDFGGVGRLERYNLWTLTSRDSVPSSLSLMTTDLNGLSFLSVMLMSSDVDVDCSKGVWVLGGARKKDVQSNLWMEAVTKSSFIC